MSDKALAYPPELLTIVGASYEASSSLTYFAGGENWSEGAVLSFVRDGQNYLVKIIEVSDPFRAAETAERLSFAHFFAEGGASGIKPISTTSGELVGSLDSDKSFTWYAWQKIEGEHCHLRDPLELESFYRDWGSLLGRLHRLAQTHPVWEESNAKHPSGFALISKNIEWDFFLGLFPTTRVKDAWMVMKERLDALPKARDNFGFIHNDLHPHNLLLSGAKLHILDWDVANYHWFMVDIAIAIYSEYSRINHHSKFGFRCSEMPELFIRPFMQGYWTENQLSEADLDQLELFLNYRRFIMYGVFYEEIKKHNPAYLAHFEDEICTFSPYMPPGFQLRGFLPQN